ncbi:MAG: hypothetical protein AAB669_02275 [Patescibacteria group bacterium]
MNVSEKASHLFWVGLTLLVTVAVWVVSWLTRLVWGERPEDPWGRNE